MNPKDNQYIVLARKYRPQNFNDLLGQDALVQTLTNAIKNNRLHHAYMLTGIRGIGKTTTARIIAKSLNCIGLNGKGGPTVNPCGVCENCVAIANDRHIDVIELDAASRTGVDDIREILDGVRYRPTSARYKLYIIDEVHMLSRNAFNALLKTLEEPPLHVKFIFATTEIRKVPVTILSRCQRFDLQRLSIENLSTLFKKLSLAENFKIEEDAIQLIAKASDGSARDGLSILDQAISLSSGNIKIDTVQDMIGLADRNRIFNIFENLIKGETKELINNIAEEYKNGASPLLMLQDLINISHMITKSKIVPKFLESDFLTETEKDFCTRMLDVSIAILSRIWQMLMKGIGELQIAPVQIDALEMILIRISYSANIPTPAQILEDIKKNSRISKKERIIENPQTIKNQEPETIALGLGIDSAEKLIELLDKNRRLIISNALKKHSNIEKVENGYIKMIVSKEIENDFIFNLRKNLKEITNIDWQIEIKKGTLGETIADVEYAEKENDKKSVTELPLVRAILAEFEDAEIQSAIRKKTEEEKIEIEFSEEEEF